MSNDTELLKIRIDDTDYVTPLGIRAMLENQEKYEALQLVKPNGRDASRYIFFDGRSEQKINIYGAICKLANLPKPSVSPFDLKFILPPYPAELKGWSINKKLTRSFQTKVIPFGMFTVLRKEHRTIKGITHIEDTYRIQATNSSYINSNPVPPEYFHLVHQDECKQFHIDNFVAPEITGTYTYLSHNKKSAGEGAIFYLESEIREVLIQKKLQFSMLEPNLIYSEGKEHPVASHKTDQEKKVEATEPNPSKESIYKALGALLIESIHNTRRFTSEKQFIDHIEDVQQTHKIHGLSRRNLEIILSNAKKHISRDIPEIKDGKKYRRLKN